jgi:hypothetical protein
MFEMKPVDAEFAEPDEPPQVLVEGEDVIALVFEPRYADLFSRAPQMLNLISRIAAQPCDFIPELGHSSSCKACDAKSIIHMFAAPTTLQ